MSFARLTISLAGALLVLQALQAPAYGEYFPDESADAYRGRVVELLDSPENHPRALVEFDEGPHAGSRMDVAYDRNYRGVLDEGDAVIVRLHSNGTARIAEPVRAGVLVWLMVLFCGVIVLTMRLKGLRVLVSFVLAGVLVFFVFLPLSYGGWPPMLLAAITGLPIHAGSILLISGWNRKSLYAIIGSLAAIAAAVWLPVVLARMMDYTGLDAEFGTFPHLDVVFWYSERVASVDFYQLFLAGAVIAAIGATMDVSITISTALHEVSLISPNATGMHLWRTGLAVGKDIFPTMAVAVVLIFIGYQFETILRYYASGLLGASSGAVPYGPAMLLNHEEIGGEMLHILSTVAALGLAVPFTAAVAAFGKKKRS